MIRPYPRYRDSGVDWLGETPAHWDVCQARRQCDIVNGGTPNAGEANWDGSMVWLTPDDLGRNSAMWIDAGRRNITESGLRDSSARLTPAGSIVLSTRAPIGHLAVTAVPAATNQGCRTLVPSSSLDSRFMYYTLVSSRPVLQSLGKGSTFMELPKGDLGSHPIPLPPLPEQIAIASFLDRRTVDIDALIERKRLLIERLAEYRTALMTRTVTRGLPPEEAEAAGLDPNPPMRDSEVEWLGEVPEHWETCPTRRRFDIVNGGTPKSGIAEYWDGSTVWITPDDLGRNGRAWISEGRRNITENGVANSGAHISPAGSIVLSTRAPIGHLAILAAPAATNQGCRTLVPSPAMDSRFAYYSFSASRPVIQSLGKGSTFMELPASDLGDHPIPLPPLAEQRAIAECLDRGTAEIDALCGQVETAIERLQEYRTALVTAAVTGKIDVRGAVEAETEGCAV